MYSRSNHQKDKTAENGRIRAWPFSRPLTEPLKEPVKEPDAPYATALDGFVELGRFLLQEASQE
jgi:hypothetical protein